MSNVSYAWVLFPKINFGQNLNVASDSAYY